MELEFTKKEQDLYNRLESKRKRIEYNQRQMYKWADAHKNELLDRWGICQTKQSESGKLEDEINRFDVNRGESQQGVWGCSPLALASPAERERGPRA